MPFFAVGGRKKLCASKALRSRQCHRYLKPVLDAMRKVGWIRDDSETWLDLRPVRQERSAAGAPATTIEIERAA